MNQKQPRSKATHHFRSAFLIGLITAVMIGGLSNLQSARALATNFAALCFDGPAADQPLVAHYSFSSGWATFGMALPRGAAHGGVSVGSHVTQTDVKNTWPDGSIKFAIVTAKLDGNENVDITGGNAATGQFAPSWPDASVDFTTGGETYTATLPAFNAADNWLSGPLVREARVVVTPVAKSQSLPDRPHPLLQVVYDVRSYAGGGHRVDLAVQNVRDVRSGNSVTYDVNVKIGGEIVFQHAAVNQPYLTRWRKTFVTDGLDESDVRPDFEPFIQSGMIPRFVSTVEDKRYSQPDGRFDILGFGEMSQDMGAPGGRAEIAPLPYWTAQYLVHKRPDQRTEMMAHANLSGSWSGHILNANGTWLTLAAHPGFWLDGRGSLAVSTGGQIPGATQMMENAHIPSLNYVPYLITGDRWHLDQLKHWGNFTMLWTWPGDSTQPRQVGNIDGYLTQNQIRGVGWGLRAIAEAASSCPDDDPLKGYFTARAQANIDWLDHYASTDVPPNTTLVDLPLWQKANAGIPMWQVSYVVYALRHSEQMGFTTTQAFINRAARFQISLVTSAGAGFPPSYGAPYYLEVGTCSNGCSWNGTYSLYKTLGEVFTHAYQGGTLPAQPWAGYYGPETRMLIMMGAENNLANAETALSFVDGVAGVLGDINQRSGFAIARR
jgi:hypothetical protein